MKSLASAAAAMIAFALGGPLFAAAFIQPIVQDGRSSWQPYHQESSVRQARSRVSPLMVHGPNDVPQSRRAVAEEASAAMLAVAATLAVFPRSAWAKGQRIKGGGPMVTLEDGVQYQEMTIGDGAVPRDGDRVAVHFSLYYKGMEVESSRDSQGLAARPLGYTVGSVSGPGSVPPGLDEVIKGMRVGGRRKISIPPELAFGDEGRPPFIPGGATVQFDVSLWSVKPAGQDPNITLPGSSVF